MSKAQTYLIDSNILITPFLNYYPMDLVPTFWTSLAERIQEGSVAILDCVRDEILVSKNQDELSAWFKKLDIRLLINHREPDIVKYYSGVMNILATDAHYENAKAIREWSAPSIADPWIVSAAAARNYTIVTFEKTVELSLHNKCHHPHIPNLASCFGVRVIGLFEMIRELGIRIA